MGLRDLLRRLKELGGTRFYGWPMSSGNHGKRYSEEEKMAAVELLREGVTVAEVARRYGATKVTVYRWIHEAGIDFDTIARSERIQAFDRDAIRQRFAEGASAVEIAEEFGCSVSYASGVRRGRFK